jgi:hypothetical protein
VLPRPRAPIDVSDQQRHRSACRQLAHALAAPISTAACPPRAFPWLMLGRNDHLIQGKASIYTGIRKVGASVAVRSPWPAHVRHITTTIPAMIRVSKEPAIQRVRGRRLLLRLGLPRGSVEHRRRPAATSPFPSVQFAGAQIAPLHWRRIRAWFAHACQQAAAPTAKHQPHARYCHIGPVNLRPLAPLSATARAANLRVVADAFSPGRPLIWKGACLRGATVGKRGNDAAEHGEFFGRGGTDTYR